MVFGGRIHKIPNLANKIISKSELDKEIHESIKQCFASQTIEIGII